MKKRNIFALVALSLGLLLTSCGETPTTVDPTTGEPEPTTVEPSTVDPTSEPEPTTVEPTSDPEPTTEEPTSELPPWVDYADSDVVRIKDIDYKKENGELRDFVEDGIAKVDLKMCIDGDTAHFYNPYKTIQIKTTYTNVLKSRFYGIDTPESTGKIQPYGKQASKYTKSVLKNAAENGTIVVTGTNYDHYEAPKFDSTGSRYLSLIWVNESVKDAPVSSLKLLNLMIVQVGLSNVKNAGEIPDFQSTFYAAEQQARDYKLKLFSGEPDPEFNYEGAQEVELLNIKQSIIATMVDGDENAYNGSNIKVYGIVFGYSNGTLYLGKYYSSAEGSLYEEGEYASLNIYTGMSAIPSKFTRFGTLLAIIGTFQYTEEFGMQVSGCSFPTKPTVDTDSYVVKDETEIATKFKGHTTIETFEDTYSNLNELIKDKSNPNLKHLYCSVKSTTEVICKKVYISPSSGDISLTVAEVGTSTNLDLEIYIPFSFIGDPENHPTQIWDTAEYYLNQTFSIRGILSSRWDSNTQEYYYSIQCRYDNYTDDKLPDLVCTSL